MRRALPAPLQRSAVALTPPVLYRAARRLWHREPAWEIAESWTPPTQGWSHHSVADSERGAWAGYVRENSATGVLGAERENHLIGHPQLWRHSLLVSHAYVFALAEGGRGSLSILDWGGGVGHFNLTAQSALPDAKISYEVKDVPSICEVGRQLQPDVRFHENDDCLKRKYDLVLATGSLQYSRDWRGMLGELGGAVQSYLFVSRLPMVFENPSYIVRQRAFDTDYVGWVINRDEFLAAASQAKLTLVREFLGGEAADVRGAPEPHEGRGFLFTTEVAG